MVLEKITAFILDEDAQNILVIHHPDGGLQLVSGTVERHEAPIDALRRECLEETGLTVRGVQQLWSEETSLEDVWRVLLEDVEGDGERMLLRGHRVEILEEEGDKVRVQEVEYDLSVHPPVPIRFYAGEAMPGQLSRHVVRHFFVCRAAGQERSWRRCDEGRELCLEWMPLGGEFTLTAPHDAWFTKLSSCLAQWG